jgi:hypothetical protein
MKTVYLEFTHYDLAFNILCFESKEEFGKRNLLQYEEHQIQFWQFCSKGTQK